MKRILRPLATLRRLEDIEKLIQVGGFITFTAAALIYALHYAGITMPLTGFVGAADETLAILSVVLFLAAIGVRIVLMRSPVQHIMPTGRDRKTIKLLQNLVFDWIKNKSRDEYNRFWRFVGSEDELKAVVQLNYEGFALSSFAYEEEVLNRRNHALWRKNPKTFALIFDPIQQEKIIGYSCMLPLKKESLDLYLQGGFTDKYVSALHLAGPDEPYSAVVVFAIVMDKQYSEYWQRGNRGYLASFINAVIDHGAALEDKLEETGIYLAQAEKKSIELLLQALYFQKSSERSAEGFPFYKLIKGRLREKIDAITGAE